MVRRIANQVHKQAARLLQSNYIKQEPAWYRAVLDHPPLPLPPKAPPPRTELDSPRASSSSGRRVCPPQVRPLPIVYVEDEVRRQFFRDHPFEAFRDVTLVESGSVEDEHPIRGKEWVRLRQHGRNPLPEEAIRFAINLHTAHAMPLTKAYAAAVDQFRALRAEQRTATTVAALEARVAFGAAFGPTTSDRTVEREEKALETWERREQADLAALAASKRWRAVVTKPNGPGTWSRGEEYVRLWKEGTRPNYVPSLTNLFVSPQISEKDRRTQLRQAVAGPDYLQMLR